jgi:hypothetical protein
VRLNSPQDEVNVSPIETDGRLLVDDQFDKFSVTVLIAVEKKSPILLNIFALQVK